MSNDSLSDAILSAGKGVTGGWKRAKRREDRISQSSLARLRMSPPRVSIKEAAFNVMAQAYNKASSNGRYYANARQIMYAARPKIMGLTGGKFWKHSSSFTQHALPDYLNEYPEKTAGWDVVFDDRGHFTEPHTDVEIGCGTIAVREYLADAEQHTVDLKLIKQIKAKYPTSGHEHRYGAVLFIEKEGFTPLLQQARIAEKYDIAILSTKGMSVGAARRLVDELCGRHELPLLIARDFDAAGFSIAHTLVSDSRTYVFKHKIPNVIDLGLRLKDVQERGLGSEPCICTHHSHTLKTRGATPEEIDFLIGGQRVELNALPSDQFIEWLETKIEAAGIKKVVPTTEMLGLAYRRAATIHYINEQIEAITDEAHEHADAIKIPPHLKRKMTERLKKAPTMTWDRAIAELANDDDDDD